jgi:hypothetical protein
MVRLPTAGKELRTRIRKASRRCVQELSRVLLSLTLDTRIEATSVLAACLPLAGGWLRTTACGNWRAGPVGTRFAAEQRVCVSVPGAPEPALAGQVPNALLSLLLLHHSCGSSVRLSNSATFLGLDWGSKRLFAVPNLSNKPQKPARNERLSQK